VISDEIGLPLLGSGARAKPMASCIYEGWVGHKRLRPKKNAFRYSVFFMYLDLAELDTVFKGRWLWSTRRFNVAYLRRKDHLESFSVPLDQEVRDLVEKETGKRPSGPIRMLTHLRYFGHNFNPATFYYCYNGKNAHVEAIVVEIHNTPWGEVFTYVLHETANEGTVSDKRFRLTKVFHVSPFMDMNLDYDWRFTVPGESLGIHMTSLEKGEELFHAKMSLERRDITGANLTRVLLQYPAMTVKVIGGIYWQALKLWLKGVPFYTHPDKRSPEASEQ